MKPNDEQAELERITSNEPLPASSTSEEPLRRAWLGLSEALAAADSRANHDREAFLARVVSAVDSADASPDHAVEFASPIKPQRRHAAAAIVAHSPDPSPRRTMAGWVALAVVVAVAVAMGLWSGSHDRSGRATMRNDTSPDVARASDAGKANRPVDQSPSLVVVQPTEIASADWNDPLDEAIGQVQSQLRSFGQPNAPWDRSLATIEQRLESMEQELSQTQL